jgi:hypothetical protein
VVGEKAPRVSDAPWVVTIAGLVRAPATLSLAEIEALPCVERTIDIHCVTRWSKPGVVFGGVALDELLSPCGPLPGARFISFVARSDRNHSTSLPLGDALALDTLFAFSADGAPLAEEHGGPIRSVVPGRYFYKSLKWLERIELLAEDRLGYWESEAGYHNHADPQREERYIAPDAPRQVIEKALRTRDFSGLDLRGIDARGRDLSGLVAREAKLRDAHFENATLAGGDFSGANLSNAHLQGADLRGVNFRRADVEGAAFDGADLTGADFAGASLFGATFAGAVMDAVVATILDMP